MNLTVHRKNYEDFDRILIWVKKNCPHYITNDYHGNHHGNELIDFFFVPCEQGKREMMLVKLAWSEHIFEPKYPYESNNV